MIWTHHLQNITYNSTFVPQGAPISKTYDGIFFRSSGKFDANIDFKFYLGITLGAGVSWNDAYDAVQKRGRVLVGGVSPDGTVGAAGGWLFGGGHGILSPQYGLGMPLVVINSFS